MKILGLARQLVSVVCPRSPRLVLFISRSITWLELRLYGMVFDEIVVEGSIAPTALGDHFLQHTANITRASRATRPIPYLEKFECAAGFAIWIHGRHGDAITFLEADPDAKLTLMLSRTDDTAFDPEDLELDESSQTSTGLVLTGNFRGMPGRGVGAAFLLIKEDDELLTYIAEAAKAGLHHRLFAGPTGF